MNCLESTEARKSLISFNAIKWRMHLLALINTFSLTDCHFHSSKKNNKKKRVIFYVCESKLGKILLIKLTQFNYQVIVERCKRSHLDKNIFYTYNTIQHN